MNVGRNGDGVIESAHTTIANIYSGNMQFSKHTEGKRMTSDLNEIRKLKKVQF